MVKTNTPNEIVLASPVKSFFVSMLTRDILLEDAILDLLDNCVDGILRKTSGKNGARPYKGYYAEIKFDKDTFEIHDNCGGIPWNLSGYAFRMGRANDRQDTVAGSVGTYGIGMKRAIFKIGKSCVITTQSSKDNYEVEITPKWVDDQDEWDIPVYRPARTPMKVDGTSIMIGDLYEVVSDRFSKDTGSFAADFIKMVESHYAIIIEKGFVVKVNGQEVQPKDAKIIFDDSDENGIRPYMFKGQDNGVDIFITVGFTRPILSEDEALEAHDTLKYSTERAGWTVVCNDRVVLYCNKSEMTGWGVSGIPQYHTQFIAISGLVEFNSKEPSKLPTTTTKRGIDASSPLYIKAKDRMHEGIQHFIRYTNIWKKDVETSKVQMRKGKRVSIGRLKELSDKLPVKETRTGLIGSRYMPSLPRPEELATYKRRISFTKEFEEIQTVSSHLFDSPDVSPNEVGSKCFDLILQEASS